MANKLSNKMTVVKRILVVMLLLGIVFSMMPVQEVSAQEYITIKVTVDAASEKLLANADKCKMFISDGHDEVEAVKDGGVWKATLTKGQENNLTIGFAIDRAYFIPTIKVNGTAKETFSWPSPDEMKTNIGISMPMSEVGDGQFQLDLTYGKTANLDPNWLELVSGIKNMDVSYMVSEEGNEIVSDDVDVTFKAKDTDKDPLVSDAVATYDFSVLMDNVAESELARPVDIALQLDENVFTEDDYVVIRNHDGIREIIDSEYRSDEHALFFSSDKFSTYTVAKAGAKILPAESPKTGDSTSLYVFLLLGLAAAAEAAVLAMRRRKEN